MRTKTAATRTATTADYFTKIKLNNLFWATTTTCYRKISLPFASNDPITTGTQRRMESTGDGRIQQACVWRRTNRKNEKHNFISNPLPSWQCVRVYAKCVTEFAANASQKTNTNMHRTLYYCILCTAANRLMVRRKQQQKHSRSIRFKRHISIQCECPLIEVHVLVCVCEHFDTRHCLRKHYIRSFALDVRFAASLPRTNLFWFFSGFHRCASVCIVAFNWMFSRINRN